MLTQQEVPGYMLRRHLITAESVVDGDLAVVDASRRNQNFQVVRERAASYQIKQGGTGVTIRTVAHEASVYQLLHSTPAAAAFRCYLPNFYAYDAAEDLLVLEHVRGAEDLHHYHARRGHFAVGLAARIGTALSCLHRLTPAVVPQLGAGRFAGLWPWVLDFDRPSVEIFREISNANVQLIRIIQSSSELRRLLAELRSAWQADALIHHDVKWDNCLVFAPRESQRKTGVKIIDWEFAAVGDPCWDAGAIFSNYLSFWLLSIPITGEEPPDRFLELSPYRLQDMQPAIRAFWRAYVRGLGLDPATSNHWLLRAVRYAAARLLQTAFEQLQTVADINGNVVCLVQLSLNILQRPGEAVAHLLGVHSSSSSR